MDYTICIKEALQQYSFEEPVSEFIRHNENITYKVTEKGTGYLLRLHKPITQNMEGVQNTRKAIKAELEFLLAWSDQSEFPVQTPVVSRKGDLLTTVRHEQEEVPCSVLRWIVGETMSKEDLNNKETARNLGSRIAHLHQFSRSYQTSSGFERPEYGIEWIKFLIVKLRRGEQEGIITLKKYQTVEQTLLLIINRMTLWEQTSDSWGFIHADMNYGNLIGSSKGISFIDFGLSGYGYYAMDIAMGALLVDGDLRDALLSGYTDRISKSVDIVQLEAFMFLAIIGYYTFLLSQPDKHIWIREHVSGLIEHLCKPMLVNKRVFYQI